MNLAVRVSLRSGGLPIRLKDLSLGARDDRGPNIMGKRSLFYEFFIKRQKMQVGGGPGINLF